MTIPLTTPLFDAACRKALLELATVERAAIWTAQFCVACPTSTSHALYKQLWQALRAAPAKCPDCRLLLAQPTPRSPQSAESAAAAMDLKPAGWQVKWLQLGRLGHMKFWIFGHDLVIIGSHNLTQSAMIANREASLLTRHPIAVGDSLAYFESAWASASDRPTIGIS